MTEGQQRAQLNLQVLQIDRGLLKIHITKIKDRFQVQKWHSSNDQIDLRTDNNYKVDKICKPTI